MKLQPIKNETNNYGYSNAYKYIGEENGIRKFVVRIQEPKTIKKVTYNPDDWLDMEDEVYKRDDIAEETTKSTKKYSWEDEDNDITNEKYQNYIIKQIEEIKSTLSTILEVVKQEEK